MELKAEANLCLWVIILINKKIKDKIPQLKSYTEEHLKFFNIFDKVLAHHHDSQEKRLISLRQKEKVINDLIYEFQSKPNMLMYR